ncbi:MAG: hypothetical protein ACLPJH_00160 [Myxococcaceae bacterium]
MGLRKLDEWQAYVAMTRFLEGCWRRSGRPAPLTRLLAAIKADNRGGSPPLWLSWATAVSSVLAEKKLTTHAFTTDEANLPNLTAGKRVCFEVALNGERLASAGIPGFAMLHAMVTWVNRRPRTRHAKPDFDLSLDVAGLDSNGPGGRGAHVHWVDRPVAPGDRVEIRIFEGEATDPPTATERFSEAEVFARQKNHWRLKDCLRRRRELDAAIARLKRAIRREEQRKAKARARVRRPARE